jgi:hypothetical protein
VRLNCSQALTKRSTPGCGALTAAEMWGWVPEYRAPATTRAGSAEFGPRHSHQLTSMRRPKPARELLAEFQVLLVGAAWMFSLCRPPCGRAHQRKTGPSWNPGRAKPLRPLIGNDKQLFNVKKILKSGMQLFSVPLIKGKVFFKRTNYHLSPSQE